MTISIKHTFQSAAQDGTRADMLQPSHWNAEHEVSGVQEAINTLYEEGNWTPVLVLNGGSTGVTYTTQLGHYSKIGNIVFISAHILLSSKGSISGQYLSFHGLPFTASNNGIMNYTWARTVNVTYTGQAFAGVDQNTDYVRVGYSNNGVAGEFVDSELANNSLFHFQLFYTV